MLAQCIILLFLIVHYFKKSIVFYILRNNCRNSHGRLKRQNDVVSIINFGTSYWFQGKKSSHGPGSRARLFQAVPARHDGWARLGSMMVHGPTKKRELKR